LTFIRADVKHGTNAVIVQHAGQAQLPNVHRRCPPHVNTQCASMLPDLLNYRLVKFAQHPFAK
jgi:hypothetical protein